MEFLGVNLDIKNLPELDPEFIPLHKFNEAFLRGAEKPVGIALEQRRRDGIRPYVYPRHARPNRG